MTQRSNHRKPTSLQAAQASNDAARAKLLRVAPVIATIILVLVLITSLTSAGVGFV
jgi:hypothetical protein